MADDVLAEKLDTMIAILQLAFREQIESARQEIRKDPVAACILDLTSGDEVDAGNLQKQVVESTKQSLRTVQRRIASLVQQNVLVQMGSGPSTRYKNTNLV